MGSGPLRFAWDHWKASSNACKHGVTFAEASTAFGDPDHLGDEERSVLVGMSIRGRLLVVAPTERVIPFD